jgi:histidinol dehydrogenase
MRIVRLTQESKKNLLNDLLKRSPNNYTEYQDTVQEIVDNVRENGDKALFEYTKKFDKADINTNNIKVTDAEIEAAYKEVDPHLVEVIRKALVNIREFHELQKQNSWFTTKENGTMLGQKVTPLNYVGVYVPGGKAVYPSSVLMNIVPAKVAGVNHIVMTTPCNAEGKVYATTLVAAKEAGVDEIYKAGGAQAIAALAFGTESVPKVDKIVGPGNIFVALAKRAVYGYVSIDSIAGPSEIMVLADDSANPRYIAADLLSQAEHDELASAILVTDSEEFANKVSVEIDQFVKELSRKEIIQKSIYYVLKIIPISTNTIKRKCVESLSKYQHEECDEVCDFPSEYQMQMSFRKDWLPLKKGKFEDIEVTIPNNYDKILRMDFNEYMELPPEESRFNPAPNNIDFGKY